mgnify:CR=1 FL=1
MLLEKIQADLNNAMKERDANKLKALRMLFAAIKNEEIKKRPKSLEEADVLRIVKSEVKKLKDAVEQFRSGGREDLVKEYEEDIGALGQYMPEAMPEEEVRKIVKDKVATSDDKNFGIVMKQIMAELNGQADGGLVSRIVKEELGR